MGTPLGPKYIPYTYMDPLGFMFQVTLQEYLRQSKGDSFLSGLMTMPWRSYMMTPLSLPARNLGNCRAFLGLRF